jgi:hypothetical protein
MEFLVKSNQKLPNGYLFMEMSIGYLLKYFDPTMDDDEVNDMLTCVFALHVDEIFSYSFFGGNEYIFKD